MASNCRVFRGLVKEVEEEINHFLATMDVEVQQLAQSETGDHITVTLIVNPAERARGERTVRPARDRR